MRGVRVLELLCWIGGALLLAVCSQALGEGIKEGIRLCGETLVPALFPFLVASHYFAISSGGRRVCSGLTRLLRPFLGVSGLVGGAFLMSLAGGYPVGARLLAHYWTEGEVEKSTIEKALCCCVNGGPSFLLSGVGVAMLGSIESGACLFLAQLLSAVTICGALFWRPWKRAEEERKGIRHGLSPGTAFVESVRAGGKSILEICLFVVTMSALLSVLESSGGMAALGHGLHGILPVLTDTQWQIVLTGLLEVTQGCREASVLQGNLSMVLCGFFVSFSSVSIMLQVRSIIPSDISLGKFYLSRIVHGALTSVYGYMLWKNVFMQAETAARLTGQMVVEAKPNLLAASMLLIAMCSMVVLYKPEDKTKFNFSQ